MGMAAGIPVSMGMTVMGVSVSHHWPAHVHITLNLAIRRAGREVGADLLEMHQTRI
jgi:hypothetical protein